MGGGAVAKSLKCKALKYRGGTHETGFGGARED